MKRKVVVINVDGLCREPFYSMLDGGSLHVFRSLFGKGLRVERAVSVFPSVTLTCQASLYTGCLPVKHNLLGNGWFNRYAGSPVYRDYTNLHAALHVYGFRLFGLPTVFLPERKGTPLANAEISAGAPTIYEALARAGMSGAVVFDHVSRGAAAWVRPSRGDMIRFALCHENRLEYQVFERDTARRAVQYLRRTRELPDYFTIYFSGLDGYSHRHGPGTQAEYLTRHLDPLLGVVVEALRPHAEKCEMYYLLTADHGQAEVKDDEGHLIYDAQFGEMMAAAGRKPFLPGERRGAPVGECDLVMVNQGGSMHLYVRRGGGGWGERPDLKNDLLPLAETIEKLSRSRFGKILPGWIEFILVKDPSTDRYRHYTGGSASDAEAFLRDNDEKYPDAVERLRGYACPRSADVVIMVNYDEGFCFTDAPHRGQHGHLHRDDSLVPLIVAGEGVEPGAVKSASIVDAAPTAAALLGAAMPEADGRPVAATG
ncbi:MAG: alkaline phosphatase family protein [bacterium]